jgi:hypothetical protein
MNTAEQVEKIRAQMEQEGASKPDIIRQIALACLGWPYVFGAWGEECDPQARKRRVRDDHPTIKSKCQVLSGKKDSCSGCQWYPQDSRVRMYDCRGFTAWLVRQVGLDLTGQGATSQYNTAGNWIRRGKVSEMPDCVCCLFRQVGKTMEHTGMHIGGGLVVDCSVNVRTGGMSGWTHYAIPVGLYREGEIPVEIVKPTLRKGDEGPAVVELQEILTQCGYNPGSVDGKFGTLTRNAVISFQTDEQLDPDGIVGRKTWAALAKAEACAPVAPGEPMTYKVICYGMRWEQVQQIREICPTAEVTKE